MHDFPQDKGRKGEWRPKFVFKGPQVTHTKRKCILVTPTAM